MGEVARQACETQNFRIDLDSRRNHRKDSPDCSRTARENFLPEACESGALGLESFDGILAFEASLSKKGKGKGVILLTSVRLLLLWCCIWALELEFEVVRLACRLL